MRFKEIISTQRIVDTETNIEYHGLVDDGLIDEINKIVEENKQLKQREELLLAEIEDFKELIKQTEEQIEYPENDRFIIDCYGIVDNWKSGKGCEKKLTWSELCDTLNDLYNNVDTDKQKLLLEIELLKTKNIKLKDNMDKLYYEIGKMINDGG